MHIDSLDILDELTDEEAGMLFKAIRSYQRCEEIHTSGLVRVAFSPFRNQFNRDNEKYEKLCEKNRLIAVTRHSTKSTSGRNGTPSSPVVTKSTDNDSKKDSDSDSDSENDNDITPFVQPEVKPSKYKFDSYQMEFAVWMHGQLLIQNPNFKKPNLESWANTLRLMLEVDKRDSVKVGEVFTWANQDDFWSSNILSPVSLRKQFDKLVVKLDQPKRQEKVKMSGGGDWAKYGEDTF